MKIEHKPVNFEDARGTITDIYVNDPKAHCTIISTKKGGVRGNHYHLSSEQSDYLISGSMEVYGQKEVGAGEIIKAVIGPGDYVSWEAGEAHEFIALEDSVFITFVNGIRGGNDYEQDTHRLTIPLHEQLKH